MALVTLTETKTHLNITTTTNDVELQDFIDVACALVQGYADRTWDVGSVTETADGGGAVFLLRQSPVTSVTSVTVTGVLLASTAYEVDEANGIIRMYDYTTAGAGNVSIVYVVGGSVPALARHAALETVRHLWQTQRGSMGARNPLGGDEYVPGTAFSLPRRVMELLDPIRNVN
jgi:hypothetical protein